MRKVGAGGGGVTELTTAWMLGCVVGGLQGFFIGLAVASRRRPTCRELMRDHPTGEPPLRLRRSGDGYSSGPTTPKPGITPKPQFPPPQIIREDFL